MGMLQISDIYETYYDGRERFPHLPELSKDEKTDGKRRRTPRREAKEAAPKDQPPAAQH
ncbi:MAG TPA: hypothetical protein VMF90_10875 [Rhizobiaceae bacterium]|nr:hypothetical protein [Rhizobiaceae bacterium]